MAEVFNITLYYVVKRNNRSYVEGPFTEPDAVWCEKMKHKWSIDKYMIVQQLVPVKEVSKELFDEQR